MAFTENTQWIRSSEEAAEAVRDRGFHKVLIVTGPKIRARGLLNELLEEMKEKKLKYVIFDGISQNPTDEEVENGVGIFLGEKCDCMIAFGGGSVMDCAKGIGASCETEESSSELTGTFPCATSDSCNLCRAYNFRQRV